MIRIGVMIAVYLRVNRNDTQYCRSASARW